MNTKFKKLLKEFAKCYDNTIELTEPDNINLTYIDFCTPVIKEYLTPFSDEFFISKDEDETIFKYDKGNNCWYSIKYLQEFFQNTINLLFKSQDEKGEIAVNMYNNCCYCFDKQQNRINLDLSCHSIDEIQYIVFKSKNYKNLFIDYITEQSKGKIVLLQEDESDMYFMWSNKYKQWESFNHNLLQHKRDLQDIWNYFVNYREQHNNLEIF